ncbi:hypothetical protein EJ03DRAFT_333951 [Teratosphaeria nubilosa]|uniref:Mtf2-like C-terminal domain-containing protein n=1 Tax=Teratosphaeria nubilosa TaxID=161662 RepID=A0A6G1LHU8_9PEZI|nr:hypothetical protein EJ03DRAFT_333951 [Teratosphaeria nubilosa]
MVQAQQRPAKEFPAALQPMADEARERRQRQYADAKQADRTAGIQRELDATNALLDAATSDVELLRTLETHVLGRVVALNLDTTPQSEYEQRILRLFKIQREKAHRRSSSAGDRSSKWSVANQNDLEIMTVNFPDHLLHYMTTSTQNFPGSLLPLNLLAVLKRFGPSVFALGATTQLYNAHLRLLYSKFPFDLHAVVEVLEEMDRAVYSFDQDTEAILVEILRDAKKYGQRREGGPALEVIWRSAKMRRALRGVLEWRDEMARRREEEALKRAREEELMREVALEEGASRFPPIANPIHHHQQKPPTTSWDDLAYTTFQTPHHSEYNGTLSDAEWEMLAIVDIASGTLCESTPNCISNITAAYQALLHRRSSLRRQSQAIQVDLQVVQLGLIT